MEIMSNTIWNSNPREGMIRIEDIIETSPIIIGMRPAYFEIKRDAGLNLIGTFTFKDGCGVPTLLINDKSQQCNYHSIKMLTEYGVYDVTFVMNGFKVSIDDGITLIVECSSISVGACNEPRRIKIHYINAPDIHCRYACKYEGVLSFLEQYSDDEQYNIKKELERTELHTYYDKFFLKGKEILVYSCNSPKCRHKDSLIMEHIGESTKEEQNIAADYISFLIGKQLIKLSEVRVGADGSEERVYITPVAGERKVLQQKLPPIDYVGNDLSLFELAENHSDRFHDIYKKYNLSRNLGLLWDTSAQYLDLRPTIYQIVVESLVDCHFDNKDAYMISEKEMIDLCGSELDVIKDILAEKYGNDVAEAIRGGMKRSIMMSQSQKLKQFGKDLGVILNGKQKDLIAKSHKIKHGEELEPQVMLEMTKFYITYCNRLILSLIGIDSYLNYEKND